MDRINQLLDWVDSKELTQDNLSQLDYSCILDLQDATRAIPNGKDLYCSILNALFSSNIKRISQKEQITVVFLVDYFETWGALDVYHFFANDSHFEAKVCVVLNCVNGRYQFDKFVNTYASLLENNISPVLTYDLEKRQNLTWNQLNINPDLIFCNDPYVNQLEQMRIPNITLDKLLLYIPYCYHTEDNESHSLVLSQVDLPSHNLFWKRFETTKSALDDGEKYSHIGNSNMVFSGYAKMDQLLKRLELISTTNNMWKYATDSDAKSVKKIIYAPHHSFPKLNGLIKQATFEDNYNAIYELAKKYQSNTSWIVRPHPQLGNRCEAVGFMTANEYTEYLNKWDALPNAQVCQYGGYFDYFVQSDAMIMDCGSFIAEYLYVNKPLLFLKSDYARFNSLGQKCIDCYETVSGKDIAGIEHFITETVIGENDCKKNSRKQTFNELFVNNKMKVTASEYIYQYVRSQFEL